jgi:hypothetical protein
MSKKIFTREEFGNHLRESGKKMACDKNLRKKALDVVVEADKYNWIH